MGWEKVLIAFSAALAIGIPAVATAWAQSKIGAAGAGSLAEKPELDATILALAGLVRLNFCVTAEGRLEGDAVPDG